MSFVSIEQLVFRHTRRQPAIIDNFSLRLEQGEIMGLIGASGSGKSTILRLIAGLEVPESGRITINGTCMLDQAICVPPERRGVGMVFQDYALFPHLTVSANILFGLNRLRRKDRLARLEEMLELVQLEPFAKRYPHELSGGQQQRVALARALAPQPALLLMDEPFSNLDAALKSSIRQELRAILQASGMTCLFVSHDAEDIAAICDRSVCVDKEQMQAEGGQQAATADAVEQREQRELAMTAGRH